MKKELTESQIAKVKLFQGITVKILENISEGNDSDAKVGMYQQIFQHFPQGAESIEFNEFTAKYLNPLVIKVAKQFKAKTNDSEIDQIIINLA